MFAPHCHILHGSYYYPALTSDMRNTSERPFNVRVFNPLTTASLIRRQCKCKHAAKKKNKNTGRFACNGPQTVYLIITRTTAIIVRFLYIIMENIVKCVRTSILLLKLRASRTCRVSYFILH